MESENDNAVTLWHIAMHACVAARAVFNGKITDARGTLMAWALVGG